MEESRSPAKPKRAIAPGPDPLIGRVINERYRVVGVVARGGMGKVYRAEQQPLGRLVALKVLSPNYTGDNDPEFHKRFFLEASIASKLSHPNTVTIFDYGKTDDDIYYIAMELLEGRTLHRLLRDEGSITPERTMHIARQICRSLREAHNIGVIHRDLKPANVFLLNHGDESDVVKVLDFGLVKNINQDQGEDLTQAGLFMGSPKYMSPEQIRGDDCDGRVDVYALGVMMFEMLTGKVPFDRINSVNILMAHIHEDVPRIAQFAPNVRVPAQLESVIRKCMSKHPDGRYPTMESLLSALKQVSGMSGAMTGVYQAADLAGESRSVELPLPTPVTSRGDLLSGGMGKASITEINSQMMARAQLPFTTPANGQTMIDTTISAQPFLLGPAPAPKSRTPMWIASACAVAALAGGAFFFIRSSSAAEEARIEAAQAAAAAAVAPPVTAPTTVQTSVLVTLRSTPPGAMVWVGEKEYGPTPTQVEWSGNDAAIGREVTFRFQRKGYTDVTVVRQIRGPQLEVDAPPMTFATEEPKPPSATRAPFGRSAHAPGIAASTAAARSSAGAAAAPAPAVATAKPAMPVARPVAVAPAAAPGPAPGAVPEDAPKP